MEAQRKDALFSPKAPSKPGTMEMEGGSVRRERGEGFGKTRQGAETVVVGSSINVGGINVFDSQTVIAFKTALEKFNDCFIQK